MTTGELRCVQFGRLFRVRRPLYMSAMAASCCNPALAAFLKRLVKAGRPPEVALARVTQELLLVATVLREDQGWLSADRCKPA